MPYTLKIFDLHGLEKKMLNVTRFLTCSHSNSSMQWECLIGFQKMILHWDESFFLSGSLWLIFNEKSFFLFTSILLTYALRTLQVLLNQTFHLFLSETFLFVYSAWEKIYIFCKNRKKNCPKKFRYFFSNQAQLFFSSCSSNKTRHLQGFISINLPCFYL